MAQAAVPLAMMGASAVSGALNNRKKTSTATNEPSYTGQQKHIQNLTSGTLEHKLRNPVDMSPLKTQAIGGVNRNFAGLQERMNQGLTARGFGKSGKSVGGTRQVEVARAGALGGLESQFAGMAMDQENQTLQQMLQFGFASPGNTLTQTNPGNMLGGAVGGAAETATLLYALSQMGGQNPVNSFGSDGSLIGTLFGG